MVLDMTQGTPIKKIMRFFVPVLMGNLLQQLYSMADSVIVSRYLGVKAFAGVTATGSLNFLILGFALGLCSGFSIPISQEFGACDYPQMRRCFSNAIVAAAFFSVITAVLTAVYTPSILRLLGTPSDIFQYSEDYIRIIFIGIPTSVFYNLFAGAMRAVGDGRTPLIMLVCSCILNIVLDLLFIVAFHWGISGAAIATVLAQLVSVLLCLNVIFRKNSALNINREEWKISGSVIKRLISNGVPMGLQYSITAVGSAVLQASVNGLGSTAVASIGAGTKIQFIFAAPIEAIGVTMATYAGQNIGAKRIDRVKQGIRHTTIVMAIYCAVSFVLQLLFANKIGRLFIDKTETVVLANACSYLTVVSAFFFLLVIVNVYRNAIQGMGYGKVAMIAGALELIGRSLVALLLVKKFAFSGACYANPSAWFFASLFLLPMYFTVIKRYEIQFGYRKE